MSGKRLLDALALLNVSRNIALRHFDIRLSQAKLYTDTSSVFKALKQRATPIVGAAASRYASQSSGPQNDGINQDTFTDRSAENSAAPPRPAGEIHVEQAQAKRRPLPDGTIPPAGLSVDGEDGDGMSFHARQTGEQPQHPTEHNQDELTVAASGTSTIPSPKGKPLSSEEAMLAQRRSENQIPSTSAEPPAGDDFVPEVGIEQEQDVFYQPPGRATPVLSALPRVRVPKTENDVQEGDSHIPEGINADVFYSGTKNRDAQAAEPSADELAQIFHSPRIAQMLGGKGKGKYVPGGVARQFHTMTAFRQKDAADAQSLKQLGADMAKDFQRNSPAAAAPAQPYQMRESRVPSSRVSRIFEYGGLAASMAFGAVSESITRSGGSDGSVMLSAANMERLVAKLSKMRGAALKMGQMMSFQDAKLLPAPIHAVLQRVQDSADYMPASQRDAVIAKDLGSNWRDLFESFEEKPMAAASIGQVHGAVMKDGRRVAVKVQYPGVADSISSDLNNLSILLTASRMLPKGLYLDKTIANARTELAWECDYIREAEGARKFKQLLADETETFTVPTIIDEASGKQVLTMERMEGVAVTKVQNFTQEQRDWIGTQILRLCLREITEFHYMQTDPNWTNFLYNSATNKLELLDFGASREFPQRFVDLYVRVLNAASKKDRKACGDLSVELGYLTGYESRVMLNAHVDSVMTLAEPFMDFAPDLYDFKDQTITDRVRALIPVMLRERLAPPPEETYSLHRKLSGAFLLCARLGSRVRCKELFQTALTNVGIQ